jgi:hypothetical protein
MIDHTKNVAGKSTQKIPISTALELLPDCRIAQIAVTVSRTAVVKDAITTNSMRLMNGIMAVLRVRRQLPILEGARGCGTLSSRDSAGRRVVVEGADLVSVVASVLHLKPCTRTSAGRKLLNGVTNGLSRVNEAAVPKPTAPARCEELGRCRVVELRHM